MEIRELFLETERTYLVGSGVLFFAFLIVETRSPISVAYELA